MEKDSTQEVLNRVDKYLSLVRYQYTSQERLSRLKMLEDYYLSAEELSSNEKVCSSIECPEHLSKKLVLPLKVKGIFLVEGKPKARYYRAIDLEKSVSNPLNKSFPLMLDHKDNEAGKVIGKVTEISYDDSIKGLRWKGHINDETQARNVMDGVVKEVSVTIFSVADYDENIGAVWKDLVFKELSLVMEGAVTQNTIEVDE